jgi:hypothetical protein
MILDREIQETFIRWIVEGSNGEILSGPSTFEESIAFITAYQKQAYGTYSASAPMPEYMVKAQENSRQGYVLKKVIVKVIYNVP